MPSRSRHDGNGECGREGRAVGTTRRAIPAPRVGRRSAGLPPDGRPRPGGGPGPRSLRPPVRPVPGPEKRRRLSLVSAPNHREPRPVALPAPQGGKGASGARDTRRGPGARPRRRREGGPVAGAAAPPGTAANRSGASVLRGPVGGPDGRSHGLSHRNGQVVGLARAGTPPRRDPQVMRVDEELKELLRAKAEEMSMPREIPAEVARGARRHRATTGVLAATVAAALAVGGYMGVRFSVGSHPVRPVNPSPSATPPPPSPSTSPSP